MKLLTILTFPLYLCLACNTTPDTVQSNLSLAGKNKIELQAVIDHYKNNEEKLKAVYFILGNMDSRGSSKGDFSPYHKIFEFVDSICKTTTDKKDIYRFAKERLALLEKKHGPIASKADGFSQDLHHIKAEYLIKNIDSAFEVWKNNKWSTNVDFDTFCNFILPYRIHNEPLSDFRSFFIKELQWLEDSMKDPTDLKEACLLVNNYISSKFTFVEGLGAIPFPSAIDMFHFGAGECEQRYFVTVSAMRSLGIPVAIDFSPQYNHWAGKHSWVSLITPDSIVPFNAGEFYDQLPIKRAIPIGMETSSTVFRNCFAKQTSSPFIKERSKFNVPATFRNQYIKNVSADYDYPMTSVTIEQLEKDNSKTVYLGCFGRSKELIAVDYLPFGENEFKNIGKCGVYVPFFYKDNEPEMISYPFIVSCEGNEKWYSQPQMDKTDTIIISRKYPVQDSMAAFSHAMVGGYFEVADNKYFLNADTLHTITEAPNAFAEITVNPNKEYQYVRYVASRSGKINIAELEFLNGSEKLQGLVLANVPTDATLAFDGNIRTNYTAPAHSWIGMDFGKPQKISKLRYLPRNNFNIIEPGDIYELLYFDAKWISLGTQKAKSNQLTFTAPRYSLLLLRNLTKGKEERIFKYENGNQIFW